MVSKMGNCSFVGGVVFALEESFSTRGVVVPAVTPYGDRVRAGSVGDGLGAVAWDTRASA